MHSKLSGLFDLNFSIKGTEKLYCLIVSINYEKQVIYIKYVLTHAEYDKDNWKNYSYF
ncbi:MAG: type II toxin-antitoxin system HigB family toxin [Nostocaceae cyanobacterium]|nr:type II toxin-antitoxin system HigB family toxin [Nostocaceae cyanobacterium]